MNKYLPYDPETVKLKYILGTYVDDKEYPTTEDILFIISKRVYDRKKSSYTFTDNFLIKKLKDVDESKIRLRLDEMINSGLIELNKEAKGSISYKVLYNGV